MKIQVFAFALAATAAAMTPAMAQENPAAPQTPSIQQPAQPSQAPAERAAPTPAQEPARIQTQDFKSWIGMKIETIEGVNVGEVAGVIPASGSVLQEVHVDIGGFLGFGETRVKMMPAQLTRQGDKFIVSLTKDEVSKLPKIEG
ncbi:MAG: PRC-barrel domain-containing protein [Hyphomicrobiales bacterium]|nr:PRC-barrel domain-containing protein [Hyphomicrobiales bacterium]